TLPPRPPHATSSPASFLAPLPMTVTAAGGAVPIVIDGAAPAPTPVVDIGVGAVPIVFAAVTSAATHR
ncbi:unnamed protein product, partial [Urochloa humidicola]